VEAYLQESGRAGRDGGQSLAVLLWGPEDEGRLALAKEGADRERLAQLLAYGRNIRECRRAALLRLLNYEGNGESPGSSGPDQPCCDVCEGRAAAAPREEETLRRFFRQNPRRCTLGEAARELAGAERLNISQDEAREAVRLLIKEGKLKEAKNWFWKGKISPLERRGGLRPRAIGR
jgi:ATP-dependent DNA helicase RecQ